MWFTLTDYDLLSGPANLVAIEGFEPSEDVLDVWGYDWGIPYLGEYDRVAELFSDANTILDGSLQSFVADIGGDVYIATDEDGVGVSYIVGLIGVSPADLVEYDFIRTI